MLSVSRILTLLAGAVIGAVAFRRKDDPNAAPWRSELEELQKKFTVHVDSHDVQMTELRGQLANLASARPDEQIDELRQRIEAVGGMIPRVDSLAVHLAGLQERIEAELARPKDGPRVDTLAANLVELQQRIEAMGD